MPFLEACTQPECLLWEEGVDCRSLGQVVVRGLAGEHVSNVMAGKSPIHPQERCMDCALRVMRGGKPGVEKSASGWDHLPVRTRDQNFADCQD